MDSINLHRNRNTRQAPVNVVMNLQVLYYAWSFLTG